MRFKLIPYTENVYCMYTFSHLFRFKIGITKDPANERAKEIESSIRSQTGDNVRVRVLMSVPSFLAARQEKRLHRLFKFARASNMVGSGKTEWFNWFNIVFAFIIWAASIKFGFYNGKPASFLIFAAIPIPIDFAIMILAIILFEWVMVAAILTAIAYTIMTVFLTYQ